MKNEKLKNIIAQSCNRIAPAWPLENSVAVNPYLGLADHSFNEAAKVLKQRGNIKMTLPISFYLAKVTEGVISETDLKTALVANGKSGLLLNDFLVNANSLNNKATQQPKPIIKTVIDAADELIAEDLNEFYVDKISAWASAYYDKGQALWNTAAKQDDIYIAWKKEAEVDYATELKGIKNFRKLLKQLPDDSYETTRIALNKLNVAEEEVETYLHALLLKTVGWSSYVAGEDWNKGLYGGNTENLAAFLAIALAWEVCLLESFKKEAIEVSWDNHKALLLNEAADDEALMCQLILQHAYDLSVQQDLIAKFENNQGNQEIKGRPKAQAVFCIDVRSEVYRRNLEQADPEIETVGFAGFFGFAINYQPIGHEHGKNQCPVLIPSQVKVKETLKDTSKLQAATKARIGKHQMAKSWKLFKSGAISSFSFVSPLGLSYLPKLIGDSFGWTRPIENPNQDGLKNELKKGRTIDLSEITLENKIKMAKSALTAMGLKNQMAPLVLITGHGSTSVNNPHATGLDCGACGGHSGEVNAMTAEQILNDRSVRGGLMKEGIFIPLDTHFVACLHDTTTDNITIIGEANIPTEHKALFLELKETLATASFSARVERGLRMKIKGVNADAAIMKRANDWAQVRPEWGLAGCHSFIVAPRHFSSGVDLGGKSFLHSYDWKTDEGFGILEAIITAPMVVTSWINLQYYASATDNDRLGAGNKTLHNVTGGIGVLEGAGGDLRIGLPLQSVHDGEEFQHLPQRLNVIIAAPIKAINAVLEKHESVKALCDNNWITLMGMDDTGKVNLKYSKNLKWESVKVAATAYNTELVEA